MLLRKSIKILLNYVLGPLLFILLARSLYLQISKQPNLDLRWQEIAASLTNPAFWFVAMLVPLNWGLEARKWQRLMQPLQKFSFNTAYRSVLAGCSITMLTPNRIGEYGGRILYVEENKRLDAISLTILGSISQLFVTLFMGCIGLSLFILFRPQEKIFRSLPAFTTGVLLAGAVTGAIILLMLFFNSGAFAAKLSKQRFFKKFAAHLLLLNSFSRKQLLRIGLLSFLRYMVFILQYLLLLRVMHVQIPFVTMFWLLTIFYLVMAMAPTIGITELPVRALASLEIFRLYSGNTLGIEAAAFGIWVLNLVIPAITGSLLIFGIKIMKDQ